MRRHWIGVAAAAHVRKGERDGFVMFAHGVHEAVLKTQPGDLFVYYAPREDLDAKSTPVRAFTAIGQIDEAEPEENEIMMGRKGWLRPATYFKAEAADIYPLVDKLSFIRDRQHWGMAFRRSLFAVEEKDFALIAQTMRAPLPQT